IRAVWWLVAVLGFEPSLITCVRDGVAIEAVGDGPMAFSVSEGGALCARCASTLAQPPTRLPPQAYRDLLALHAPAAALPVRDSPHPAAHRRLVARRVRYHLGEAGPLSALGFWAPRSAPPPP